MVAIALRVAALSRRVKEGRGKEVKQEERGNKGV
jgi:hypothetical protein